MLRLVITFLPKSKFFFFNFMAAVIIWGEFGAQENIVSDCFHCFPIYFPWNNWPRCHDLSFMNVEFSLSSFTFSKRPFSFPLLSVIKVVSSAYLRLLIFLPAILVPGCASSRLAFFTMQYQFSSVQSPSFVQHFATLWIAACQASLSITNT